MEKHIKNDIPEITAEDAGSNTAETADKRIPFKKRLLRSALLFASGAITVLAIGAARSYISETSLRNELKNQLMRDWESIEETEGVSLVWVLDFSEDKVAYRADTGYSELDRTLAEYDYKVTGRDEFSINRFGKEWEKISVHFSEDGTVMFITPSFTDGESASAWFNFNNAEVPSEDDTKQ